MTTNLTINTSSNLETKISDKQQEHYAISEGLCQILADTHILYLKTHNFHWNVTGTNFYSLHQLFEKQYKEMATAVDNIAERIRTLGFPSPGSYSEFLKLASIPEAEGIVNAEEMILLLTKGNEAIIRNLRLVLKHTQASGDAATADLLTKRIAAHEKNVWMLRSLLQS